MARDSKTSIHRLLSKIQKGGLTVRYWDGDERVYGPDQSDARIVFYQTMPVDLKLIDPMMAFGEAYMDEIFDIEGNWADLFYILSHNRTLFYGKQHSKTADYLRKGVADVAIKISQKENIHQHYDLGNDFFSLWLDETMSYSCGYFKKPDDTLYKAQIQKIDHILKKLQLKQGERLLDIGSGWGWLIMRAAEHYDVQATGITISEAQFNATSKRIKERGLEKNVQVKLLDYLDLDPREGQFEKIVSVGMYEHVGKNNHARYMKKVEQLLVPEGLSLLHTISSLREGGANSWTNKYIFPGGYIPSLRETINLLPDYNFHLLHAESLRLHYALTLDHWYKNFSDHQIEIKAMFDQRFVRMWRLYLGLAAAQFRSTGLDLYQYVFSKGLNNHLQMTLDHICK